MKEAFILAHGLRMPSIRLSIRLEQDTSGIEAGYEAASHSAHSQDAEREMTACAQLTVSFLLSPGL